MLFGSHFNHAVISKCGYFLQDENGVNTLVVSHSGDHGDKWHMGMYRMGKQNFILRIEATGTAYTRKEIAIDDIQIVNCLVLRKLVPYTLCYDSCMKYKNVTSKSSQINKD